jgi:hypothetical protein
MPVLAKQQTTQCRRRTFSTCEVVWKFSGNLFLSSAQQSRPSPFVTQVTLGEVAVGILKLGLNVAAQIQRTVIGLPAAGGGEPPLWSVSRRLLTDYIPGVKATKAGITDPRTAIGSVPSKPSPGGPIR